jgi:Kef-type K+ transport system membrane component KefB
MEERVKIEQEEHPVPTWIKLMWGVFIAWGLFYLGSYWLPDLARWVKSTDPDATQWHDYR